MDSVQISHFSYKRQTPPKNACVIDCRSLPNPWFVPSLRHVEGTNEKLIEFLKFKASDKVDALLAAAHKAVKEGAKHVAFGCTHGRHRSVAMAEMLRQSIKASF